MAFITRFFELAPSDKKRPHSESECSWRVATREGRVVLQLDTYGSDTRKDVGTISQSVQLDEAAALELMVVMESVFPGSLQLAIARARE